MTEPTDPEHSETTSGGAYRDPSWVVLSEHDDRLDVAFIEDQLTRAGVPSTTTRRADDERVVFRIMVTAADEVRARQVVGARVAEPASPASAVGKSPRLVWGLALVPGCAHLYAGGMARGALLVLAFLSTFYWSSSDHVVVLAPFVLFFVDALGARAELQGRQPILWRILAWTAPLWVAAPGVLQKVAPNAYIGSAGRAVCAAEERCGLEIDGDCATAMAGYIGAHLSVRGVFSECATFLEGRSCEEAYGEDPWMEYCSSSPFCAFSEDPGEGACRSIYSGNAGFFVPPPIPVRPQQGWGM